MGSNFFLSVQLVPLVKAKILSEAMSHQTYPNRMVNARVAANVEGWTNIWKNRSLHHARPEAGTTMISHPWRCIPIPEQLTSFS